MDAVDVFSAVVLPKHTASHPRKWNS